MANVAGIIDKKGGFRVVVTERHRMKHHVGAGERLFVLPRLEVQEPIPFEDIHPLVTRVEEYITAKTAGLNACGGCQECCITPRIESNLFSKNSHTRCLNCSATGCRIYFYRPRPCREFQCLWLKSQRTNHPMPAELRPDRTGVYFVGDVLGEAGSVFEIHTRDGDASLCERKPVKGFIEKEQAEGRKARLITGYDGDVK